MSGDFKLMNRRRPQDDGPEDHDDVAVRLTSRKVVEPPEVYFIPVTRFSRDYLELGNERFSRLTRTPTPCRGKKSPFCYSKEQACRKHCKSHVLPREKNCSTRDAIYVVQQYERRKYNGLKLSLRESPRRRAF